MSHASEFVTIKQRSGFRAAASSGKKWVAPGFILQINATPREGWRYGLTASKKSVGNAVARNRARRRLRALAREVLLPHALPGHDYVLIARDKTSALAYNALRDDLVKALQRLKLWRDA